MAEIKKYNPSASQVGNDVWVTGVSEFSLKQTLDCGQAFRFDSLENHCWCGVAYNKILHLCIKGDKFILYNISLLEYNQLWKYYFDIERDYGEIIRKISSNPILKQAAIAAGGIRILKQDPWEAICSFIISQNNNIPRIKGIIERLCENFGDTLGSGIYGFPSADKISLLDPLELAPIRSGFRARYIIDAARKITSGEINIAKLVDCPIDEARNELQKICGVGLKVADCALLFGFGRIEAFPRDVWIKRAMEKLFDGELPPQAEPFAGIVQQYIFHYSRTTDILK